MSRTAARLAFVSSLAAAALAATGCGVTNPYASGRDASRATTTSTSTTSAASTVHADDPSEPTDRTSTTPADSGVTASPARGTSTPRAALAHYARLYINWSARTLGTHQRTLAALSAGVARAKALQAAASYGRDPLLRSARVSNHGQIIALARGQDAERGWWVIVTRERTSGQGDYQGLPATTHVTYAQLQRTQAGWLVNQWSPQS